MTTYKVIQDVEAEDKLVWKLSLRQFIYACIAASSGYIGVLAATKHAAFLLVFFAPVSIVTGFFAFPWDRDQPTEIWALAKLRFFLKPRKRIWDQSGVKELVTITAPKVIEKHSTDGLNQNEVRGRLAALANTIDSRGWAIKNVNINLSASPTDTIDPSDRLVAVNDFPQEVSNIDIHASDDMLDETANPVAQHFDSMIATSTSAHHKQILAQMQQPAPENTPPSGQRQQTSDYWFVQPQATTAPASQTNFSTPVTLNAGAQASIVPQAATPTIEEEMLVQKLEKENAQKSIAYEHLKTVKTPEQLRDDAAAKAAAQPDPIVTPQAQAAIINLANNDDLDVATIARQAHKETEQHDNDEVVISLR